MKKTVVVIAFALLVALSAVGPVFAKGPVRAGVVGHNPNIQAVDPVIGLVQLDASQNTMIWVGLMGIFMHDVEAGTGAGRMNNAIIADQAIVFDMLANPETYHNKWVFLSGGETGMLYLFALNAWGPDMAAAVVEKHPNGVFMTSH